ncbi:MAG: peptidase M22 [Ruminococcaceae bacterium]|nr:peptidase M22 [Oscillospiraceae bacterium]
MADKCYVGIDTSNYTTSLAVADENGEVIANLKLPLPVKEGGRGLRQSEAVFAHVKNLPRLMPQLGEIIRDRTVMAVGVSVRPRDAEDSYMPCFLTGEVAAASLAASEGLPIHRFSHQNGHLMAALYSSGATEALAGRTFGAFHVSGGTTELLLVRPNGTDFTVELLGGSADLHAGQAVDRIGVALGLSFPCGPALERLAATNTARIPRPRISVREGVCNLSGLENLALELYKKSGDKALTAAFVLRFLSETLGKMAEWLREQHGELPILFSGGVMSNRIIAAELRERLGNVYFAEPAFSADNAAGIALLCRARALAE